MSDAGGPPGPHAPRPYNPLEKRRLAESIVRELLLSSPHPLPPADSFVGSGIYLIYYCGSFALYRPLAKLNTEELIHPIYVGQAIPPGRRKGGFSDIEPRPALFKRLAEHAATIRQAENLEIDEFRCRFLVIDEFWISLAESLLIESYRPLWNVVVEGFGNHPPGIGRAKGKKPSWDTIHPGRKWAAALPPSGLTKKVIEEKVREHLLELPGT